LKIQTLALVSLITCRELITRIGLAMIGGDAVSVLTELGMGAVSRLVVVWLWRRGDIPQTLNG
jgi:hypothetical protein